LGTDTILNPSESMLWGITRVVFWMGFSGVIVGGVGGTAGRVKCFGEGFTFGEHGQ
jgi:hypothetical protein